jgi:predicted nucleic acid-binding protein
MGSPPVKIADALKGVQRLAIDTAPIIYYVENHLLYADKMELVFQLIQAAQTEIISSIVTLTEVLTKPLRVGDVGLEKSYHELFYSTGTITLVPIDRSTALLAADLRARYNLRTPDAFQIAVAIHTGCDAFLTNDLGIKRVTKLRVLVLDELELEPPTPPTTT